MKQIIFRQPWQKVAYKNQRLDDGFKYWSTLVLTPSDDDAKYSETRKMHEMLLFSWLFKFIMWNKIAILKIEGEEQTAFRVGFYSKQLVCRLSPEIVIDGERMFAVRRGPEENDFFVVARKPVDLRFYSQTVLDSKVADKYKHLQIVI